MILSDEVYNLLHRLIRSYPETVYVCNVCKKRYEYYDIDLSKTVTVLGIDYESGYFDNLFKVRTIYTIKGCSTKCKVVDAL